MNLKSLLAEIELDVRELKYLTDSFLALQDDEELKDLLHRKIQNAQSRLGDMLLQIDAAQPVVGEKSIIAEEVPVEVETPVTEVLEEATQVDEVAETIEEEVLQHEVEVVIVDEVPIIYKEESSPTAIIGEQLRSPGDLRRSISLNDSFRFSRELFDDDSETMNRVLEQVSHMQSYDSAVAYLSAKIKLNEEDETVADLLFLLKKYFN